MTETFYIDLFADLFADLVREDMWEVRGNGENALQKQEVRK